MTENIIIQSDYWCGTECLTNGVPWQTPESIYKEDMLLRSDDVVLEMGTGGSTIFLSRRCKKVIAVETNFEWYQQVLKKIKELGLTNIDLVCLTKQEELEQFILNCEENITVFSVDTIHGYNRSRQLDCFLKINEMKKLLRLLILDNYGDKLLFPNHFQNPEILPKSSGWDCFTFNDPRWCGCGTRLYSLTNL
jgi:hypothetical protein